MAKVSISFKGVSCIYGVKAPNGKIYIGQTWDLYHRYKSGVSKNQRLLYRSYKKHGEDNHQLFTIVQFVGAFTQQDLDYWERYYIEVYRSEGYELLNIREGGGNQGKLASSSKAIISSKSRAYHEANPEWSKLNIQKLIAANKGSKRAPESRKAISEALRNHKRTDSHSKNISLAKKGKPSPFKGKTLSEESKRKLSKSKKGIGCVAINQFDLNGNLIKEWHSIKQAAETLNLPTGTIGGCVRKVKHYKTCGGFIWRYKSDDSTIVPQEHKQTYNPKECPVIQLTVNGDQVNEFNSVKDATNVTGINRICIIMTCRGTRKTAGGFIWKYK